VWFRCARAAPTRGRWTEIFPVTPATLLAAKKCDTSKRRQPGPTAKGPEHRLATENPLWDIAGSTVN
jgi:hypothetical protein